MNRATLVFSILSALISFNALSDEIKLTGSNVTDVSVNNLHLDIDDFEKSMSKQGLIVEMKQNQFEFSRGYDDGFVGPASLFQTDNIVSCSQPLRQITSLTDFNQFPNDLNPFPIFGITSYNNQPVQELTKGVVRLGFRLYEDSALMDVSGLVKLQDKSNEMILSSIETEFGKPSFVIKRKNGWRALYINDSVDAQALQLEYENALDPEKKANYLNTTLSTVLYGVLLDASFNSDLPLDIKGDVLEFFISEDEGIMVFTKFINTGKFIQRFNTELERCDSVAD